MESGVRQGGGGGFSRYARREQETDAPTLSLNRLSSLESAVSSAREHAQLLSLHHIQTPSPAHCHPTPSNRTLLRL